MLVQAVPVEDLINRDFKSNFEIIKWFKSFYAANVKSEEYDPVKARGSHDIRPLVGSRKCFHSDHCALSPP